MANAKRTRATLRASNKVLQDGALIGLTNSQYKEVSEARAQDLKADTKAALERPSELTPRQLKALAKSEAIKANRKTLKDKRKLG
jgi:hypothetical protein